ncbi:MAG: transposase [Candidatus Aenigmarchaeota archaeon]|nr:transposase [Candidatus Aenigmarchaeota archaeon]
MYYERSHVIITEGGLNKNNQWVDMNFFPYEKLRKIWQYNVLTNLKKYFTKSFSKMKDIEQKTLNDGFEDRKKIVDRIKELNELIDRLFKEYDNGFYVYAKDRIHVPQKLIRYIGRYIRHPAIAESRIVEYSPRSKEDKVVFYYEDEKNGLKEKKYVTMTVFEFIEMLIKHVPDKNFKMVRWYGLYSRRTWKRVKMLMALMGKYSIEREQYLSKLLGKIGQLSVKNAEQ